MADLNSLIAQGFQFKEPPDPFAQYAQMQQLQRGEETGRMNQMLMQEKQRGFQEQNALRGVMSRPGFDLSTPESQREAYAVAPTLAEGLIKGHLGNVKTAAEVRNLGYTGQETQARFAAEIEKKLAQAARDLVERPDNENIISHNRDVQGSNLFTAEQKAKAQAKTDMLLALPMDQRAAAIGNPGASAADMGPKVVAPGASLMRGGTVIGTAPEKTPPPPAMVGEYTFAKTPEGGGFRGSYQDFVTARAAAGRAPVQPVAPTVTQIVDPTNPNQMITIDARRYQGGGAGSLGVIGIAGKEPGAALRQNKTEIGRTQLADDLDNLRESFRTLDEMRAIPSTERNVLSNLGSATAASGMGQMLGRAGGTEAQVERDVINSARMRLINSIKNATGMSAQQLNSNVELQTMLKSISDPGQSVQAAMRIIDDIENAYVKGDGKLRKSGKVTPDAAARIPGQGQTPLPQAAVDALKAGRGTDAQFDEMFGPGAAKRARGGK